MARVVVCGYAVRHPLVGQIYTCLHYVFGLRQLGHEVAYVEESGWPGSCYDPVARTYSDDPGAGLDVLRTLLTGIGLDVPVWYVDRGGDRTMRGEEDDLRDVLRSADLLLNLGGVCWLPEFRLCPRRALVDMDPVFTQHGGFGYPILADHDVLFTYAANIASPGCSVPTLGLAWWPTLPPVAPELWSAAWPQPDAAAPFTTVANWTAYGTMTVDGRTYGQKDQEFLRLGDLPLRAPRRLELALSGTDGAAREELRCRGWSLRDGHAVSVDAEAYRDYLACSRGEFSVAKHAYVTTRSGWFSDRSVCYLATGRPVVLQNTGFTDWLDAEHGVLAFATPGEALARLHEVEECHERHRLAARQIAEETFGYRVVLPRLLEVALGGPGAGSSA
jgi:hypothetical protein